MINQKLISVGRKMSLFECLIASCCVLIVVCSTCKAQSGADEAASVEINNPPDVETVARRSKAGESLHEEEEEEQTAKVETKEEAAQKSGAENKEQSSVLEDKLASLGKSISAMLRRGSAQRVEFDLNLSRQSRRNFAVAVCSLLGLLGVAVN